MNSNELYNAIEKLASLKPKEKEAELRELLEYPQFRTLMRAALDPFVTYGVKKYKKIRESNEEALSNNTLKAEHWEVLDLLAERQLTGNAAINEVERIYRSLSFKSAELFDRILQKDLKAGFSAKLVNKVKPGMIFVFECMLSHKYEEKRIKEWPVHVEPKLDGVRVLAIRKGNSGYRFFSRTGKEFHNFEHIAKVLNTCPIKTAVFDGEVVNKSGSFNETVGDVHKKGQQATDAVFHIFDAIHIEDFTNGESTMPQFNRKRVTMGLVDKMQNDGSVMAVRASLAHSHDEIMTMYSEIRSQGGEGVIVKPMDGKYSCKRSYDWLKIKDQQTADVVVVDLQEGTGKFEGSLGALVVDFNGVNVNVGSGLTDDSRSMFWGNKQSILNKLVEVEYHEVTPDGSLRHPRFVRVRNDKPIEDGVGV